MDAKKIILRYREIPFIDGIASNPIDQNLEEEVATDQLMVERLFYHFVDYLRDLFKVAISIIPENEDQFMLPYLVFKLINDFDCHQWSDEFDVDNCLEFLYRNNQFNSDLETLYRYRFNIRLSTKAIQQMCRFREPDVDNNHVDRIKNILIRIESYKHACATLAIIPNPNYLKKEFALAQECKQIDWSNTLFNFNTFNPNSAIDSMTIKHIAAAYYDTDKINELSDMIPAAFQEYTKQLTFLWNHIYERF